MNLYSIINPNDLGGMGLTIPIASTSSICSEAVPGDDIEPRRSARTRYRTPLVSSDTTSSDQARPTSNHTVVTAGSKESKPNVVTKTKAVRVRRAKAIKGTPGVSSGSGRNTLVSSTVTARAHGVKAKRSRDARTPTNEAARISTQYKRPVGGSRLNFKPLQPRMSATQEIVRRARAVASQHSVGPGGGSSSSGLARKHESVMDVVLNAQRPNRRLYLEDLQDAIDECYRVALSAPASETDDVLADMFVPGRYARRQAALAGGAMIQRMPEEFTANEIYRVSAERSTVTWEPWLDDNAAM